MSETEKPIEITMVAKDHGEPYVAPARTLEEEVALQEQAIQEAAAADAHEGGDSLLAFRLRQIRAMGGAIR